MFMWSFIPPVFVPLTNFLSSKESDLHPVSPISFWYLTKKEHRENIQIVDEQLAKGFDLDLLYWTLQCIVIVWTLKDHSKPFLDS